jgi:hypothetical protein
MSKYIVEIEEIETAHWYTRAELKKMFAKAQEVVEVKAVKSGDGDYHCRAITGRAVKLYAAKVEEKNK